MPAVIETRTDAFASALQGEKDNYASHGQDKVSIRRPLRGIEIKDDTYATIKVIALGSKGPYTIPLVDAGGPLGPNQYSPTGENARVPSRAPRRPSNVAASTSYSNFIIQSITDSRQEKAQFMETFGDTYVFFFGERPRVLTVTGLLFNTLDFNWRSEFWYNYENYLRGTKLVENNARIYLHWDDIVVEGYMMGAEATDNADFPYHIPFSFQLFVTNHTYLYPLNAQGGIGDPDYPIRYSASAADAKAVMNVANTKDITGTTSAASEWSKGAVNIAMNTALTAGVLGTASALNTMLDPNNNQAINTKAGFPASLMKSLLINGVIAQSVTFLQVINNYYKNEYLIGKPKRLFDKRTKIRDNQDEYIGSNFKYQYDEAAIERARAFHAYYNTFYDLEGHVLYTLNAMNYQAIQFGDYSGVTPLSQQHRFQVAGSTG